MPLAERSVRLQPFKKRVERILIQDQVPVIPLSLTGLWGGAESRETRKLGARLASFRPFRRITLSVGEPVAPAVMADELHTVVRALRGGHP